MTIPNAKYVIDNQGQKINLQLPVKEWEKFIQEFKRIETLLSLKKKLRNAFMEVGQIQRGEREGQLLTLTLNGLF
jgi:hypothetical protein